MTTHLAREELSRVAPGRPSAVTLGKFDGVHRAHQALVGMLLEQARARDLASVVVTLHPHPVTVLRPGTPITNLCSLEERVDRLRALGVDRVGVLTFTSELAELSFREFIELIVDELDLRLLVVGPDFALGRDREGSIDEIRALGQERGFDVVVAPLLSEREAKVGSATVREALVRGDMEMVTQQLGRHFALHGPVIRGAERGKSLGFPTANIAVAPDLALPSFGVYVTTAYLGEAAYSSVTNIGLRPTFDESRATIETYILDYDGDFYEQELRIEVLHRLRDEKRFSGVEELVAQIKRDVAATREYFAQADAGTSDKPDGSGARSPSAGVPQADR